MIFLGGANTKVASYSSSSRSGKHVLTVKLEYTSAMDMAYDMERLDEARAEQNAAKKTKPRAGSKPKTVDHQKPLALPAPDSQ